MSCCLTHYAVIVENEIYTWDGEKNYESKDSANFVQQQHLLTNIKLSPYQKYQQNSSFSKVM